MTDFTIDGVTFKQRLGPPPKRGVSDSDGFVIVKSDAMLSFYRGLAAHGPQDVLEVGMYEGGSLVLFDKIYKPGKLVGLDIRQEPIAPLEDYCKQNPHVRTYYNQMQQDPDTRALVDEEFPDGVDLIVDDASHLYDETKATFEMLFPTVRPGGYYVIEDWSWAHRPGRQKPDSAWFDRPALTNLILELVVRSAHSPAIESMHVESGLVAVKRGEGPCSDNYLDLTDVLRGRILEKV